MNFKGDESKLTENQRNILFVYKKHRNKNLHKMKDIPVFKNEPE